MVAARLAWPVILILAMAGCAAPAAPSDPVRVEGISSEQQAALADGEVSEDEYQEGFRRFQACMSDAGYELLVPEQQGIIIEYSIPQAGVDSGADAECYDREYRELDMMWQLAHQDSSPTAEVLRDCLVAHGIPPEDTVNEMVDQLEDAGIEQSECAS